MTYFYMYEIRNKLNGKIYVGVHKTKNIDDGYMGSGKVIKRAIAKHGIENFEKVILETFENAEAMYAKEKEVVNEEFLARDDVYNLRRGGSGGFDHINKVGGIFKRRSTESARKGGTSTSNRLKTDLSFKEYFSSQASEKSLDRYKDPNYIAGFRIESNRVASQTTQAREKRLHSLKNIGHQQGENNSQAGTMWITDGVKPIKIKKTDSIPDGYRKGRKKY